jgi:hypothetical protein
MNDPVICRVQGISSDARKMESYVVDAVWRWL